MTKCVYIAGPMTGLPEFNFPAFFAMEKRLGAAGFETCNPARNFNGKTDLPRREYVKANLYSLQHCDTIVMLPEWTESRGAKLEFLLAYELGLEVLCSKTLEVIPWDRGAPSPAIRLYPITEVELDGAGGGITYDDVLRAKEEMRHAADVNKRLSKSDRDDAWPYMGGVDMAPSSGPQTVGADVSQTIQAEPPIESISDEDSRIRDDFAHAAFLARADLDELAAAKRARAIADIKDYVKTRERQDEKIRPLVDAAFDAIRESTSTAEIMETLTNLHAKTLEIRSSKSQTDGDDVPHPTVESILDEAARLTSQDRQLDYGHPKDDFARTAAIWTALFADLLKPHLSFSPQNVGLAMIAVKLSREAHWHNRDNLVDVAGYAQAIMLCLEDEPCTAS